MATSKNRRKNGKVKSNNRVERMRRMAAVDLKDYMLCNVVMREELVDNSGLTPKTVLFNRKTERATNGTNLSAVAMFNERWRWCINFAMVCRDQNGKLYLDRHEVITTVGEHKLTDLNDVMSDKLVDTFELCNPLHRLTMVWVATPYERLQDDNRKLVDMKELKALLFPLWHFGVLGNLLTQHELSHDKPVLHYKAETLDAFVKWYLNQDRYREDNKVVRNVHLSFERTSVKPSKGELSTFKAELIKLGFEVNFKAFIYEFEKHKLSLEMDGIKQATLMTALDKVIPNCIRVIVECDGGEFLDNKYVFNAED